MQDKNLAYQLLKREDVGNKIHISFSEFTKYQGCGHRHLVEKYLKLTFEPSSIHLVFGNSIHKALELGLKDKSNIEERVMVFREDFYKEMHDKLRESPDFKDFEDFMEQGENIIRYIHTEDLMAEYDVIGVEFVLYEPLFGPFHFKGFIDLVLRHKITKKYLIVDWKTSGQEWDVSKKKKDLIFMCQMRFYKYFFSKKYRDENGNKVALEDIDCKYIVLNRLIDKKYPKSGFGSQQDVEIYSTEHEIEESLTLLAETIRDIHIENNFPKAKLINKVGNCFFCPLKNNIKLCNGSPLQSKELLKEDRESKIKKRNEILLKEITTSIKKESQLI